MSTYSIQRCLARAENCRGDGDPGRIIREHDEAARSEDAETARIAAGFAIIARRRRTEERWRADAYARLARGETLPVEASMGGSSPADRGES